MFGAIYKITFPHNKTYVGRTRLTKISEVICRYRNESLNSRRPVALALKKYGLEKCKFEFIYENKNILDEKLNKMEIKLIKENQSMIFESGYNVTEGGENTSVYGSFNGRYVQLEDSLVDKINQMRSEGISLSKITRDLGLPNRDIVKRRLLPHLQNIKTSEQLEFKGTWKNVDRSHLEQLISEGKTVPKISIILEVGKSVIRKRLLIWNLKTAKARK